MARPATIDTLPEAQRKKVVDALIAGQSLRKVAKIAGVSHTVVQDYKRRVVMPAIVTAQKIKEFQGIPTSNAELVQQTVVLTQDIVKSSPFRERLESLWQRTEKSIERAETAVRAVTDRETGELVAVGPDVSAIAPLINQAHKNLEMLGNATGELNQQAGAGTTIQIVTPAATINVGAARPEITMIDVTPGR